jgi:very-short-patch-repair endonuclease
MKSRYMKPLRWPTDAEKAAYMRSRQSQNIHRALTNANENWLAGKLESSGYKWTRQAIWGYRVFDFWCHELGVAVESDGPEHKESYDAWRDDYNLRRSGVLVLRVRNRNEEDAEVAIAIIAAAETWGQRREGLRLNAPTKKGRQHLISGQQDLFEADEPNRTLTFE